MNDATHDEKIGSILRRAVRVGFVRVYPGLEDALDRYSGFCFDRNLPVVAVFYGRDITVVGTGMSADFTGVDYRRVLRRGRGLGVTLDRECLEIRDVGPTDADDVAHALYRLMLQAQRIRASEAMREIYPGAARSTTTEAN
jgi:hypothetical protein